VQHAAPQAVEEARDAGTKPRLQDLQDLLKEKTEEIAAINRKYKKQMLAFVVFVFGLLVGKMFMQ
jgi:gas vesicle protein